MPIAILLNGTELNVQAIQFKEAGLEDDSYFHDCYITFEDGEVERYDACDVTILAES